MPPINTIVVQTILLPPDRRDETVLGQAQRLLTKSLAPVDEALEIEGIDELGLDRLDRIYLQTLSKNYSGGVIHLQYTLNSL